LSWLKPHFLVMRIVLSQSGLCLEARLE
jgi:hypothetical protein